MPQPPQLSMWRIRSTPSSVQMYELSISQAEPSHPTNQLLYPRSHSFSRYPKLVTKVEGWNTDCLPVQLPPTSMLYVRQVLNSSYFCQNNCKHATSDGALEPWQVMARNQTYHSCWEGTLNIFVSFCNSSLHHVAHSIVFSKLLVTAVVSIMSTLDSRGVDYTLEYRQVIYGFWWSQITLRKALSRSQHWIRFSSALSSPEDVFFIFFGSWCGVVDRIIQGYLWPCLLCSDPTHRIQPEDKCRLRTWQTCRKWDLLSPLDCGLTGIQIQEVEKCAVCVCVCVCVWLSVFLCSHLFCLHTSDQTNLAFFPSVFMM